MANTEDVNARAFQAARDAALLKSALPCVADERKLLRSFVHVVRSVCSAASRSARRRAESE